MTTGNEIIRKFEAYCPQWLSEEGDVRGLQVGTLAKPVEKVMVTLDIRPSVVEEAIEKGANLIIAKHAPLFRPVGAITSDSVQTKMLIDLIKHDIAVYVAHTNMDIVPDGLNDWFCETLGFEADDFLRETHQVSMMKLAVFVPIDEASKMREVLGEAGAGRQGNYINTSYSVNGMGRFTPVGDANPAIGSLGKAEAVQETRLEVIFPETKKDTVLQAMLEAHSYEEPAYDVYRLENQATRYGIGRIGNLPEPVAAEDFIVQVKQAFDIQHLRVVFPSEAKEKVQRIAICGGSGEKFYRDALRKGADVYITGDVYYHTAHDMQSAGLTVIDPGHNIESLCKKKLAEKFGQWKKEEDWQVAFILSEVSTEPFSFR